MEGSHFSTVDQFGMAQKGGAVTSHIRIASSERDVHAVRLGAGSADLVLGCDSLVTASDIALDVLAPDTTRIIQNTHQQITGHFNRDRNMQFPVVELDNRIATTVNANQIDSFNATAIATRLLGDSIASNLFMLGYAYQQGLIPVSARAIEAAIELNAVAVDMNKNAFVWGRRAARDMPAVLALISGGNNAGDTARPQTLDEQIEFFTTELAAYHNNRYAKRYRDFVGRVGVAGQQHAGSDALTLAVAKNLYKLMAIKDEYEVARLFTDGSFETRIREQFEGDYRLLFHLAPPLLARRDGQTGQLKKRDFGGWMMTAMRLLAKFKFLRGSALDVFGYTAERRAERELLSEYQSMIESLLPALTAHNMQLAIELAELPDQVRGYGHVKEQSIGQYRQQWQQLLQRWPDQQHQQLQKTA